MKFIVEEEKEFESKYLGYGMHQNLKIDGFVGKEDLGFTPRIILTVSNTQGQTAELDLYMNTEVKNKMSAQQVSMKAIKHLWDRQYLATDLPPLLDKCNSIPDLVNMLNSKLTGKVYDEFMLNGKEIPTKKTDDQGKPYSNWFKAVLGFTPFCSTKYSPKKLTWDESKRVQKLPVNTTQETLGQSTTTGAQW